MQKSVLDHKEALHITLKVKEGQDSGKHSLQSKIEIQIYILIYMYTLFTYIVYIFSQFVNKTQLFLNTALQTLELYSLRTKFIYSNI